MPGVQQGVGTDEDGQVTVVSAVEDLGEAVSAQALADHEAVSPEGGEFCPVELEVALGGGLVELVPEFARGWVPAQLLQKGGLAPVAAGKLRRRDLPDFPQFPGERRV